MEAKTTQQKLDAALALVEKYRAELKSEAILKNIAVGDDVDFTFGRADNKRSLKGTIVVGLTDEPKVGLVVGIEAGEGFDKKVYKVRATDITENRTAAKRPVDGDADPLNAA